MEQEAPKTRLEVPIPSYPTAYVTACGTIGGHYAAIRFFGPVKYSAVAVPCENDSERSG